VGLEEKLEAVARTTDLSTYDLRQKCIGTTPTLLKRSGDREALIPLANAATQAGLAVVCVADDDMRALPPALQLKSIDLEDNAVIFHGRAKERVVVSSTDPLLIVVGALDSVASETAAIRERASICGEVPESDRRLNKISQHNPIADIYHVNTNRLVRIEGNAFNYAGMKATKTDSAALNFEKVIRVVSARSAHTTLELGFGLSTIPDCVPMKGVDGGDARRNLPFFTKYAQLMTCCYRSGLYSMIDRGPETDGKTRSDTRSNTAEPAFVDTDPLPAPPSQLCTVSRGRFSKEVELASVMHWIQSLGPNWLIVPLLCLLVVSAIGAIASMSMTWLAIATLAFGLALLIHGIDLIARKRLIENTPTSRIRSMAMGFVELAGKARQKYALKLPYLLFDCVFYRYRILQQAQPNNPSTWIQVESGSSGPVPFYVEDETGRVLVDPRYAIIGDIPSEEFSGAATRHLGGIPLSPLQKAIFEYIPAASTIYVYGIARPITPNPHTAKEAEIERLRQLKRSPELLDKYDTDRDGRIDEQEWSRARMDVQRQVDAERLLQKRESNGERGDDVVVGSGKRRGLFYIRGEKEEAIVKQLHHRAVAVLVYGCLAFVTGFVYLFR
jgi:hypothetical protein